MKKKSVMGMLSVVLTVAVMSGCSKQEEPVETVIFDTGVSLESSVETASEVDEAIMQGESGTEVNEVVTQIEEKYIYHQMENPSWEYYHENGTQEMSQQTVFLEKLDETANGISDVNQWISANKLDFKTMPYSDEDYSYSTYGYNAFDTYELLLWERIADGKEITLSFLDYNYADYYVEADKDFVFQRIIWAKVDDGILYVATGHYTYAASSPDNAYITAIDLEDYHVIWKTAPLTCNSLSFEVIGDAICCGYGFTAEDDLLYILDKKTGMVQESIPLKTAADYIYQQDDILYVHTYDSDLRFKIIEK